METSCDGGLLVGDGCVGDKVDDGDGFVVWLGEGAHGGEVVVSRGEVRGTGGAYVLGKGLLVEGIGGVLWW